MDAPAGSKTAVPDRVHRDCPIAPDQYHTQSLTDGIGKPDQSLPIVLVLQRRVRRRPDRADFLARHPRKER